MGACPILNQKHVNFLSEFEQCNGDGRPTVTYFFGGKLSICIFCGFPFGHENSIKDKNPKVGKKMGLVHLFPLLSENTPSSKLVQSRIIFWMESGMKRSKEDLMSRTQVTAIRGGPCCILITWAAMQGGSFPGQEDHSMSPFSGIHISQPASC